MSCYYCLAPDSSGAWGFIGPAWAKRVECGEPDRDVFPLLHHAWVNRFPVMATSVSWLDNRDKQRKNYMQIFRVPFSIKEGQDREKLLEVCGLLESAIRLGVKASTAGIRTMSGIRDIIGRDYRRGDQLRLSYIRNLSRIDYPEVIDGWAGEYLADVSLVVIPGSAFAECSSLSDGDFR